MRSLGISCFLEASSLAGRVMSGNIESETKLATGITGRGYEMEEIKEVGQSTRSRPRYSVSANVLTLHEINVMGR